MKGLTVDSSLVANAYYSCECDNMFVCSLLVFGGDFSVHCPRNLDTEPGGSVNQHCLSNPSGLLLQASEIHVPYGVNAFT